jgi:hypothetical protein
LEIQVARHLTRQEKEMAKKLVAALVRLLEKGDAEKI